MKRVNITIIIFILFSFHSGFSQHKEISKAENVLKERGEVYFRFILPEHVGIENFQYLSIDKLTGDTVFAYANQKMFRRFVSNPADFEVLTAPGMQNKGAINKTTNGEWSAYPSFPEYVNYMKEFAATYPDICLLDTIGFSEQNRPLLVVKISDNVNAQEAEPEFFYSSTMHGDETAGYVFMLRLIDTLLSGYSNNAFITDLVNNTQIWINPLANPDGTYFGGENTITTPKRYNINDVDLNRNFPNPLAGEHPDDEQWQDETIAMMNFMDRHMFSMSANLHGGIEVINYPWDTWEDRHSDDQWFIEVSRRYVDTVHKYSHSGYMDDLKNGITHGYDWYIALGTRQDYITYYLQGREITFELSNVKFLPESSLDLYWEYNYRSLLHYVNECNFGIQGVVTNAANGDPVKARINVQGANSQYSFVYSNDQTGFYARYLNNGTYTVVVDADGFDSKMIEGVAVHDLQRTPLNISLQPSTSLQNNWETKELSVYPNPAKKFVHVNLPNQIQNYYYEIIDANGRGYGVEQLAPNGRVNIKHLENGWYALIIYTMHKKEVVKFMKY